MDGLYLVLRDACGLAAQIVFKIKPDKTYDLPGRIRPIVRENFLGTKEAWIQLMRRNHMMKRIISFAAVAAMLLCCDMVVAQNCGCGSRIFGGGHLSNLRGDNCGRGITNYDAEAMWANYCNEDCGFGGGCGAATGCGGGGGCRIGGKLKGLFAGRGAGAGGAGMACGGCNQGCFGYPSGGCGCGGGGMMAGGRFAGKLGGGCGCKLGGKLKGMFASTPMGTPCGTASSCGGGCGCKLGGKLKGLFSGLGSKSCGGCRLFSRSRNECGCSGAYFNEAVGYEYGNAGLQSCVAGCSAGCSAGVSAPMNSMTTAPMAAPAAPATGSVLAPESSNNDPVNVIQGEALNATQDKPLENN